MPAKKEEISTNELIDHFRSQLGSGTIKEVDRFISTGSTLLDYAIANQRSGGIPAGRIIEICGNESTGKSLLAYHILANTQKQDGIAIYLDFERAAHKQFMTRMGIDIEKLYTPHPPKSIEDTFVFIENVVKQTKLRWPNKEKLVTIVIDSVAALESLEEVEKEATDTSRIGPEARAWSRCLKKYIDVLDEGFVTIVLINQLRTKTVSMPFQDPDVTPGGKAIPFYCSVRIKLKSLKQIKDNSTERTVGVKSEARVFKNKIAPGHRHSLFPIMYDWGIQDEQSIYDYFWEKKLITGANVNKVLEDKEANVRFEFKHGQWSKELNSNPQLAEYVKNYLDKDLIITFEKKPELAIDMDSILEVQQLKDELEEE